jgi:DNA polymerase-3 subunit alpha
MPKFIHLRVHSNYSIGEGSLNIADIADCCLKHNMPAVGLTDTNNAFGAREFSYKISALGIKPIIGLQIPCTYQTKNNKSNISGNIVLYAKSALGYKNILKIHDIAYKFKADNHLESPEISFENVLKHSQDVICLSGGAMGFLAATMQALSPQELASLAEDLKNSFKSDFYIEICRLFSKKDMELEPKFLELAKEFEIPIVATADVLFKDIKDYKATDILVCIGQGVRQDNQDRKHISEHQYFKSQDEMVQLFADLPEAIENTVNIAKKCNYFVDKAPLSLPKFSDDEVSLINTQANEGLQIRLKQEVFPRLKENEQKQDVEILYQQRLDFELDVISKMGFSGYFLIVSDFIKWAKNQNIPVGPGRGSGAGSLVAWCLFITDVNPIAFSLLFERFLNPERISMPDFDIDFCQDRRDEVIAYVQEKYGADKVAHIITFGTLQAKAAIKDVGRAMGLPYGEVDGITKKIPYSPPSNPTNLKKIVAEVDAIKEEISSKDHVRELFDTSLKLEGMYRNISTHAAGVIISKDPLNEVAPLYYDDGATLPSVGFSMKYIEDVGLVKFDFLALKTLTIIQNALDLIKITQNKDINILNIPYKDEGISKLISSGLTLGVFQLESSGMTDVIKGLKPDRIEDIIAIISLYRPGPMENIPTYIDRKFGKEKVTYLHEKMAPILDETFGIMIYQEQVMEVAKVIAGYTLAGADLLRRAMGKKDPVEMEKQRSIFVEGAKATNNIQTDLAVEIFNQMEKFAGYGFNKSHATAYALISWQTAFLKAYYPGEFLASSMSADINSNSKDIQRFLEFLEDAKKFNIAILPPSVNDSIEIFSIEKDENNNPAIRYSLLAIKGVGTTLVETIKKERDQNGKFKSLEDFLQRVNNKQLNKRQLESLIKSGALDIFNPNRKMLFANVENILNYNNAVFEGKNSNQIGLFDMAQDDESTNILTLIHSQEYTPMERMIEELEVMGCFLSGHPLNEYKDILDQIALHTYTEVMEEKINGAFIAGFLMKIKIAKSKSGVNFANLTLYDKSSVFSLVLFGDNYNKFFKNPDPTKQLKEGANYIIKTNIKVDEEDVRIFVESLEELHHGYKVKKSQKKKSEEEKQEDEPSIVEEVLTNNPINVVVLIKHTAQINALQNIVLNEQGEDNLVVQVQCGQQALLFEQKNITLNKNVLTLLKNQNIEVQEG